MEIYKHKPNDWRELQIFTAKFLNEIGYDTRVEENILTVRGTVNVDVFAKNDKIKPHSILICECKYWSTPIPQTIVHAFRTVINDIGANNGFIISKLGFQSGAVEATKNTNLNLFTWCEFQNYFKENWIKAKTSQIHKINQDLLTFISAGFPVFFKDEYNNLSEVKRKEFEILNTKYFQTAFFSMEHDYRDLKTKDFDIKYFEMLIRDAQKIFGINFTSYEDFFDYLIIDARNGVQEFDQIFQKELRMSE